MYHLNRWPLLLATLPNFKVRQCYWNTTFLCHWTQRNWAIAQLDTSLLLIPIVFMVLVGTLQATGVGRGSNPQYHLATNTATYNSNLSANHTVIIEAQVLWEWLPLLIRFEEDSWDGTQYLTPIKWPRTWEHIIHGP